MAAHAQTPATARSPRARRAGTPLARLAVREVDKDSWPDMVRLFESRGGPKNCWCMVWRGAPGEPRRTDGRSRKAAMQRRVAAGTPVGILGYLDGEPVAWCSIAPRETYRPLGGPGDNEDAADVWSLVCFFVTRDLRGRGITVRLIAAAVAHARARGAKVLEAYPVDPDSPSYRFMGFIDAFRKAGFTEVGRAGTRRHVMRRKIRPPIAGGHAADRS